MRYLISLLLILICCQCTYIENLTADGDIITEELTVTSFSQLVAEAPCNIFLQNGTSNEITVEGYDYLLEELKIESKDGVLTISHPKKDYMQRSKLPTLFIKAAGLNRITAQTPILLESTDTIRSNSFTIVINGGAKFTESDLVIDCKNLTLNIYGNNNIGNNKLSGQVENVNFTMEGSVNIDALELKCNQSVVAHKSIGNCYIHPDTKLKVLTYSSGNTYYKGNPEVEHIRKEVPYLTSSGKVIKIDN